MARNENKQNHNVLILLFTCPFLVGIGIDLYSPSLPIIADYYHISSSLVQLTISFYMLSQAVGQFSLGILSDIFGRRKILLFSSFIFTAASIIAAFSFNVYMLILCRFLQGLGIAGMSVVMRAVAVDCLVGNSLAKAMNNFAIGQSLGPIIRPFIGGYLQHYFNWQADFYFFSVYGLMVFLLIFLTLPETHVNLQLTQPKKILTNIKTVTSHKLFLFVTFTSAIFYMITAAFNMVGPFLVQNILHFSVVSYGKMALLLGGAFFLGNVTNRILINYVRPMRIVSFSAVTALVTALIMLGCNLMLTTNIYVILLPVWIIFFLCGLIIPNMIGKSSTIFPANLSGTASAVFGSLSLASLFAISLCVTLLKTNTAVPLSILYIGMILIVLAILKAIFRLEKIHKTI